MRSDEMSILKLLSVYIAVHRRIILQRHSSYVVTMVKCIMPAPLSPPGYCIILIKNIMRLVVNNRN